MKQKKNPQRTCIGCRIKKNQNELVRFVDVDGEVQIDVEGKKKGRGCYLCKTTECIDVAEKRKAFQRSFKRNLSSEEFEKIKDSMKTEVMKSET